MADHPYASVTVNGKTKLIHRLRAEKALGKPLPKGAVVHHADGSVNADAPLVICQDQRYHFLLHIRQRVLRAGGDPNTQRICWKCKELKAFAEFQASHATRIRECRACASKARGARQRRAKAA